jgi:NAD(P)-dependent dehydrogenase (short-subunit alcohol dehydrogenase family)
MTDPTRSMAGEICLVTGATAGIGFATALGLARQGATVVGVGRNPDKCRAGAAQIRQETGNPAVEFMQADLSSQAEVRRFAEEFKRSHPHLDVLVNNVGAFFMSRRLSADGIEMTWALNYLGVYLLTELLLDTLKASAPREASLEHSGRESRVVNVSSAMHTSARLNFDDLQGQRKYSGMKAYGQSKLAMVMYTCDLASRLAGTGVTVNALHPGFVASDMYRSSGGFIKLLGPVINLMAVSPEAGAETSIFVAGASEIEGVTGKYFVKKQAVASSPASCDTTATARLMALTAAMVGQDSPA